MGDWGNRVVRFWVYEVEIIRRNSMWYVLLAAGAWWWYVKATQGQQTQLTAIGKTVVKDVSQQSQSLLVDLSATQSNANKLNSSPMMLPSTLMLAAGPSTVAEKQVDKNTALNNPVNTQIAEVSKQQRSFSKLPWEVKMNQDQPFIVPNDGNTYGVETT